MTHHETEDLRKNQILDAAVKLFSTKGFEETTVDEVAETAGLSKGAIYWYFKGKLDLLIAINDHYEQEEQDMLIRLADMNQYGPQALYKAHRDMYEMICARPEAAQMFNHLSALAGRVPEIQKHMVKYHRQWDKVTSSLIQKGIDAGHFRPVDTVRLAQAISALWHGAMIHAQLDPDLDLLAILETATRLFYDALIIKPEPEPAKEGQC